MAPIAVFADWLAGASAEPSAEDAITFGAVVAVVVLLPAIETLIFQVGAIGLLRRVPVVREHAVLKVLLAGTVFGVAHYSSPSSIIVAAAGGVVLAYAYVLRSPPVGRGFLLVALAHSIHNAFFMLLPDA